MNSKQIGKYVLKQTIGKGSIGKVKLAINIETGEKFAAKFIPRPKLPNINEANEKRTVKEIVLTHLLDNKYIVTLHDFLMTNDFYILILEYVEGGQLLDFIIHQGRVKEDVAKKIMIQIVEALEYCHKHCIVHRDLKIENILLKPDGTIKFIDFGLSNYYSAKSHLETFCGSLYFAAPELLLGKQYIGPEVDIWSLGVVLYVLLAGRVPFDDPILPVLHRKILKGKIDFPAWMSSDAISLLKLMLARPPLDRATLNEIKSHQWFQKLPTTTYQSKKQIINPNVIRKMLESGVLHTLQPDHLLGYEISTNLNVSGLYKILSSVSESDRDQSPLWAIYKLISHKLLSQQTVFNSFRILSPTELAILVPKPNVSNLHMPPLTSPTQKLSPTSHSTFLNLVNNSNSICHSKNASGTSKTRPKHRKGQSLAHVFFPNTCFASNQPQDTIPEITVSPPPLPSQHLTEGNNVKSDPTIKNHVRRALSISVSTSKAPHSDNEKLVPCACPPKIPFMKGLLSTRTTTFKSPHVVRDSLIKHMNQHHISWKISGENIWTLECHVRGVFRLQNGSSDKTLVAVGSPKKVGAKGRIPSFQPRSPSGSLSSYSDFSDIDDIRPEAKRFESAMLEETFLDTASHYSQDIRFEVSIFTISLFWTSMHGIRFKKLQGSAWVFKNIVDDILKSLHL